MPRARRSLWPLDGPSAQRALPWGSKKRSDRPSAGHLSPAFSFCHSDEISIALGVGLRCYVPIPRSRLSRAGRWAPRGCSSGRSAPSHRLPLSSYLPRQGYEGEVGRFAVDRSDSEARSSPVGAPKGARGAQQKLKAARHDRSLKRRMSENSIPLPPPVPTTSANDRLSDAL